MKKVLGFMVRSLLMSIWNTMLAMIVVGSTAKIMDYVDTLRRDNQKKE